MRGVRIPEARRLRELRRDMTAAEAKLWQKIRNRKLNGFKFVRQEPIGPYYADFACREMRLVIEIDGATHSTDEELAYDERRTSIIEQAGYRVIRFHNADVYEDMESVLNTLLVALGVANE